MPFPRIRAWRSAGLRNLVEATAKLVLKLRGLPVNDKADLAALAAQAAQALGIHPASAGDPGVLKVHGRLLALTQYLGELRNKVGDGHGAATAPMVAGRDGRLAARAAIVWCGYVLDVAMGTN